MRRLVCSVSIIGALSLACAPARADDDHPPRREWFGYQTLFADTLLITTWATYPKWPGFDLDGVVLFLDVAAYMVVSPVIHMVHESEYGGLAFGLRLGLPALGTLVGLTLGASTPCQGLLCGLSNAANVAFGGMIAGAVIASLVDGVALAWKPREPKETRVGSWSVAPFGLRGGGGLSAGRAF